MEIFGPWKDYINSEKVVMACDSLPSCASVAKCNLF